MEDSMRHVFFSTRYELRGERSYSPVCIVAIAAAGIGIPNSGENASRERAYRLRNGSRKELNESSGKRSVRLTFKIREVTTLNGAPSVTLPN